MTLIAGAKDFVGNALCAEAAAEDLF